MVISRNMDDNDALGIDKLTVDYEYLLYRINDYVEAIQLQSEQICQQQNDIVGKEIIEDTIDYNIQQYTTLLADCAQLENHMDMLVQLNTIVESFKDRLQVCNDKYVRLIKNKK